MKLRDFVTKAKLGVLPYSVVVVLVIFTLAPVMLLILNSLKSSTEVWINIFGLPRVARWNNFVDAWRIANYNLAFRNSILVTGATVGLVCLVGSLAAYPMARFGIGSLDWLLTYFLLAMAMPAQLYLIPLFFMWKKLNLVNTLQGIILVYVAIYLPFSIFLLRSYMLALPKELEDAARIDGCSEFEVFWKIILPLSRPALLAVAVVVGVWSWNEFLFAITFLHLPELKTVAIKYLAFVSRYDAKAAYINASGVILMLPPIIFYILLQKRFVRGMTAGAFKA